MSLVQSPIYSNNRIVDINGEIILGTTAKSVAKPEERKAANALARRRLRFQLQATARRLLPDQRVAQCMHRCGQGGVAVNLSPSTGLASFSGVATCGSVWHCPVCSAKITNNRRNELNTLLSWAREDGYAPGYHRAYQPLLITLTARHGINDSLAGLLGAMKLAKKKLHQTREWKAVAGYIVGHVTATEVTYGSSGWHVHYHMLVIVDCWGGDVLDMFDLEAAWLRCLSHKSVALSGNGHAYQVQGASAVEDYITKWGAGEELTLSGNKDGRKDGRDGKGRTPWELLADAETDQAAAALFVEYAREFKGKRQLVWSRGLKDILGIIERTDEEVAEAPDSDDLIEIAIVPKDLWRVVCARRLHAELLEVAESTLPQAVHRWLEALQLQIHLSKKGFTNGSNTESR